MQVSLSSTAVATASLYTFEGTVKQVWKKQAKREAPCWEILWFEGKK